MPTAPASKTALTPAIPVQGEVIGGPVFLPPQSPAPGQGLAVGGEVIGGPVDFTPSGK